jgi:hypothetical protein
MALHTKDEVLRKARCLAKMVAALVKRDDVPKCHEIDQMAQEAQYVLIDTKELEEENGGSK